MNERNCKECAHKIAEQMKIHGGEIVSVEGCEVWECEFKEKESDGNSRKMSYL